MSGVPDTWRPLNQASSRLEDDLVSVAVLVFLGFFISSFRPAYCRERRKTNMFEMMDFALPAVAKLAFSSSPF